jgi:hypothetical protein|tara:strand:+ start:215 stop:337 length:123 start_codon:yes stop_codon:yes gene_type:complete
MITKTKFWKLIRKELKDLKRSKEITAQVMEQIKTLKQNED